MNKEIINENIINQINNQSLFEPSLFDFLLKNSDLKKLQDKFYNVYSMDAVYFKANFEGFIFSKLSQSKDKEQHTMLEKIISHYNKDLLEPIFSADIDNNSHNNILTKNAFILFKVGFNSFFQKLKNNEVQALNKDEEKFVINYLMSRNTQTSGFNEETKSEIYNILLNQKDFIQLKNKKSTTNIFLQNAHFKKVLELYSNSQREEISGIRESELDLVNLYHKKLYRSKFFDLSSKLADREPEMIFNAFESVVGKYKNLNWFSKLITYGTEAKIDTFDSIYNNKTIPHTNILSKRYQQNSRHPKAISEMISLIEIMKDKIPFTQEDIHKLFIIVIYSEKETNYLHLRRLFDFPNDNIGAELKELKILGKTISEIEKIALKQDLEKNLITNNIKQTKVKL